MRTIHFTLDEDQAEHYNKIANLTQTLGVTPKNFFLRAMRMELASADLAEAVAVAAKPKPKGRPAVVIDGLERKEWIAERIESYRRAEKDAIQFEPDHEVTEESLVAAMAETCWNFAEECKPVPLYLRTKNGGAYTIDFPRLEGE